jgi:glycosyltransferase involved in cell wall biosynthesis
MEAAAGVLVGSRHTAESLWAALDLPGLEAKTRLGPPGVDVELFAPIDRVEAAGRLRELADYFWAGGPSGGWDRSPERAADAVEHLAAAEGPRVVLVGKMIVSKGIDLLLAAWPLVVAANPGARLLIVGFGEYEHGLLDLWRAIESGDLGAAHDVAKLGRKLEGGPSGRLEMLSSFLERHPAGYEAAASAAAGSVSFAGRLEHDEVGRLVPACDVLVFPSTFPEAFGMVAAEAAAAGVAPVSADHSGAAEVSRALAADLPPEAAGLVSFPLSERAVLDLADRINGWLALDPGVAAEARRRLRETASRLWSWEGVARGVLAASAGQLADLPPVPDD